MKSKFLVFLIIGSIPSFFMLICSYLVYIYEIKVNELLLAACQYFSSGLLFASISMELFPLLMQENNDSTKSIGIVMFIFAILLGFLFSFILIRSSEVISILVSTIHKLSRSPSNILTMEEFNSYKSIDSFPTSPIKDLPSIISDRSSTIGGEIEDWENDPVIIVKELSKVPNYKRILYETADQINQNIEDIYLRLSKLYENNDHTLLEQFAEEIDLQVHLLQYKIDHFKRYMNLIIFYV